MQSGGAEAAQLNLRAEESAVPELLNLAWAQHEVDADAADQARTLPYGLSHTLI